MTQHDDPVADAAARAVQLLALSVTITEAVARLRAERLATRAFEDERAAAVLRAQDRVDRAAAWLARRAAPALQVAVAPVPAAPSRGPVVIVCSPRDLADQAFPVPMPQAMATAPRAADGGVHVITTAPGARPPLPPSAPSPRPGGAR